MTDPYEPHSFEPDWIARWQSQHLHMAPVSPQATPKRYVLEMFPYPSGDMHMGHVVNYAIADAVARYLRMRGFAVLHPMGYDALGLPAENAAIARGIHPREWTYANIARMRQSQTRLGFSYDWDRQVVSADPDYYRWNQWIFLRLYERGLAYRKMSPVNWCPSDKTVLAKEQISAGVCWRCGSIPEIRDLEQWFLKITDYADRLLDDMEDLRWPESILSMQRNWIGRSRGAEVTFRIRSAGGGEAVEFPVFTTRPDTLWGATFFVIAPEHEVIPSLVAGTEYEEPFAQFLAEVRRSSEIDRMSTERVRRGMALPVVAINPVNGEEIPVWTADYVLMGYGTGAIMAVPAHDQRDFEFAGQYGLEVRTVIQPEGGDPDGAGAYTGAGVMVNSGPFDGTVVHPETLEGIEKVIAWLEEQGKGRAAVNYRLRDWLVSRQRYWGTPIPIIHCPQCGEVPVRDEDLPVTLPEQVDYTPNDKAVSPLANDTEWTKVACPRCGGDGRRETDTMDTFFDSSWYFLRFCDPHNLHEPFSPRRVAEWGPVDRYIGGAEHAVMHLIYARFFTKVFQDMGLVDFSEPFLALFNQGNITMGGKAMSKSLGNVVEASAAIDSFGADAARVYILFCSPADADYDFPADGLEDIGRVAHSWLSRVWRVLCEVTEEAPSLELQQAVHRTVRAVTEDFEAFKFNTAIARLMELVNELSRLQAPAPIWAAQIFLLLLAPIAPFITEELWHRYGNPRSIFEEAWPGWDEDLAAEKLRTMVVQVNGKVRDRIDVPTTISEEQMKAMALSSERVRAILAGREPARYVVVPPQLVNVVV